MDAGIGHEGSWPTIIDNSFSPTARRSSMTLGELQQRWPQLGTSSDPAVSLDELSPEAKQDVGIQAVTHFRSIPLPDTPERADDYRDLCDAAVILLGPNCFHRSDLLREKLLQFSMIKTNANETLLSETLRPFGVFVEYAISKPLVRSSVVTADLDGETAIRFFFAWSREWTPTFYN